MPNISHKLEKTLEKTKAAAEKAAAEKAAAAAAAPVGTQAVQSPEPGSPTLSLDLSWI